MLRILIYIIFLSLNFSCTEIEDPKVIKIDLTELSSIDNRAPIDLIDSFSIIIPELTTESEIGRIRKVMITDEYVLIWNKMGFSESNVLIFDIDGNYISKIEKIGKGPKEYVNASFVDFDEFSKSVRIIDSGSKRILEYGLNGEFINYIMLTDWIKTLAIYQFEDVNYLVTDTRKSNLNEMEDYQIKIYNQDGETVKKYFPYSTIVSTSIGNDLTFWKNRDGLSYYKKHSDSVLNFRGPRMALKYQLIFPKPLLSDFQVDEFMSGKLKAQDFTYNINYSENDDYIAITYLSNRKIYFNLYNKKNGYLSKFNSNDNFSNILGAKNDKFITIVEIYSNEYEILKLNLNKCKNCTNKLFSSFQVNSNPMILTYKLK